MDPRRFDALTLSLATAKTRRGLLGGIVALVAGVRAASAQSDCPPGQTRNRKGECNCPAGTDVCPDGCYNLKKDLANCGRCGRSCAGGECVKGECRCPDGAICGCGGATTVFLNNAAWTSAGSYPVGGTLSIGASGEGGHCPAPECVHGPDGNRPCSPFRCGALTGTFDPSNPAASFLIGSGTTVVVTGAGNLSLRVYDTSPLGEELTYADNYGAYCVTISGVLDV